MALQNHFPLRCWSLEGTEAFVPPRHGLGPDFGRALTIYLRLALRVKVAYVYGVMNPPDTKMKLFLLVQRQAGLSRRKSQELVAAGEVSVDGNIELDPYLLVDVQAIQRLSLRGHPLPLQAREFRAYRYHKPMGMLCSHDDPHQGNTVGRILRADGFFGYSWAGRLDQDAEGLLLITNDGVLLNQLSHPRYQVPKTYRVWLDRIPNSTALDAMLQQMKRGIDDDGDRLRILSGQRAGSPPYLLLRLTEGRKREIKRLFAHFHLQVVRLLRIGIGPVELGNLRPGAMERMTDADVEILRNLAREAPEA